MCNIYYRLLFNQYLYIYSQIDCLWIKNGEHIHKIGNQYQKNLTGRDEFWPSRAKLRIACRMRIVWLSLLLAPMAGCGSAQDELQAPAQRHCKGIGLSECGELTLDVHVCAAGEPKKTPAEAKVEAGTGKESPAPAGSSKAPEEKPKRTALHLITADTDPDRMEGGVASPGASPAKVPCASPGGNGAAVCIKATEGPFIVTDLIGLAGCPNDLFAAAGGSTAPRWQLPSPSGSPLSLHGGRLIVKAGEFLFIGASAAKSEKIGTDHRCLILWSGFRPYGPGDHVGAVPRDLGF